MKFNSINFLSEKERERRERDIFCPLRYTLFLFLRTQKRKHTRAPAMNKDNEKREEEVLAVLAKLSENEGVWIVDIWAGVTPGSSHDELPSCDRIKTRRGQFRLVLHPDKTRQFGSEFPKNAYSECEDAFNKILNQIRNKVEREAYVKEQIVKRAGDMLRLPTFAPPDNNWLGCSELNLPKGVEVYVVCDKKLYFVSILSFNADSKRFEVSNLSGTCKPAYETTKEMIDLDVEKDALRLEYSLMEYVKFLAYNTTKLKSTRLMFNSIGYKTIISMKLAVQAGLYNKNQNGTTTVNRSLISSWEYMNLDTFPPQIATEQNEKVTKKVPAFDLKLIIRGIPLVCSVVVHVNLHDAEVYLGISDWKRFQAFAGDLRFVPAPIGSYVSE